jgi:Ulp1 family protease
MRKPSILPYTVGDDDFRLYLRDEHQDKKSSPIDLTQWNFIHVSDIPQQMNGSDCGMFTCKYAEFVSRGKNTFDFNQVTTV